MTNHLFSIVICFGTLLQFPAYSQPGGITFSCSDTILESSFNWAKQKALYYAHSGDPVGLWYESALPGREAFCMRDVSHQSMGAAMLGLQAHNKNMFEKFARGISESKDYCSFWEINRYDKPAPVDYKTEQDFWYNLPANFDVIYNCYGRYLWTGDTTYIADPAFLRFYELSLNDYVDRWELNNDKLESRNRLINIKYPENPSKSFYHSKRGIPTYNAGDRGDALRGIDMTASYIAALHSYANILDLNNSGDAKIYRERGLLGKRFLNEFWWDNNKNSFKTIWYSDKSFDYFMVGDNQAFLHYLLYFDVLDDPEKTRNIISDYVENNSKLIVELKSFCRYYRDPSA